MSPTWWVGIALVLILLRFTLYIVPQQSVFIIERLGRFHRAARAGLGAKVPLIDRVAGKVSLRVQLHDVLVETKTEDNVFLRMVVPYSTAYARIKSSRHSTNCRISRSRSRRLSSTWSAPRSRA